MIQPIAIGARYIIALGTVTGLTKRSVSISSGITGTRIHKHGTTVHFHLGLVHHLARAAWITTAGMLHVRLVTAINITPVEALYAMAVLTGRIKHALLFRVFMSPGNSRVIVGDAVDIITTGQKVIVIVPQLVQERNRLAMQRLQQNIGELQAIMSADQPHP